MQQILMAEKKMTASWMIVRIEDNQVIAEIFSKLTMQAINTDRYKAVPIMEYLKSLNDKRR